MSTGATFRVLIYGASGVGKTQLVQRMISNQIIERKTRVGDYTKVSLVIGKEQMSYSTGSGADDEHIHLEIYDNEIMRRPHAVIGIYDRNHPETFDYLVQYLDSILTQRNALVFLVIANASVNDICVSRNWSQRNGITEFKLLGFRENDISGMIRVICRDLYSHYFRDEFLACESITRKLFDHPMAELFRYPVDTDDYPTYRQIVKYPMDLSTVLDKLGRRKYRSVNEWQKDIELIWSNCKLFNKDSFKTYTDELQRYFHKMKKKEIASSGKDSLTTLKNIANEILQVVTEMNKLAEAPPPEIAKIFPKSSKYSDSDTRLPFTDKDIIALKEDYERFDKDCCRDDAQQFAQIVRWFNVLTKNQGGTTTDIDVSEIPDPAKIYMRSFLKEKLARK